MSDPERLARMGLKGVQMILDGVEGVGSETDIARSTLPILHHPLRTLPILDRPLLTVGTMPRANTRDVSWTCGCSVEGLSTIIVH